MMKPKKAMPEPQEGPVYKFAGFTMDVTRRQLLCEGAPVSLTSKAFDTLLILIRHRGTTVSKSELMNSIWADTAVEENNLTQQISSLRRALGERPDDHRFIVTVPGRGYSFVAEVLSVSEIKTEILANQPAGIGFWSNLNPAALRGYGLAFSFVAVIAFSFAWTAIRDASRPQTLAVLSFKVSASGDEFIGNGISETLRARLGSVQDLIVRPGDLAAVDQDALAAGRRLRVDTVVTGSVLRDHDRIRVAVEMLDVSDGRIVWGKTFDDSAANLFALQDSIAGEVARVLNINLTSRHNSGPIPVHHASAVSPKSVFESYGLLFQQRKITSA